jgi:hypothetical protein
LKYGCETGSAVKLGMYKTGFDVGFDFEIFEKNQVVKYSTVVTFKQDFDRILYEYLCSVRVVPSRHNCGIISKYFLRNDYGTILGMS